MLKNLFISKVRIKLLEQFIFNQSEEYHVRGLVRIMNEEINAIRRELINLRDAGILKSQEQGNKIVYTLNPECPILPELISIIYKDSVAGRFLYELGSKKVKAEIVILAKPYITGKYETNTDVDVLFVGNIDIKTLTQEMKEFERLAGREIRYSVITMKDFDFAKKKRESFLTNILDNEKILLLGSEKTLAV